MNELIEIEHRGHLITVREFGTTNGKPNYCFNIQEKPLGRENYASQKKSFFLTSEAIKAGEREIDLAFDKVERLASLKRELTKNDLYHFLNILAETSPPKDQKIAIAVEMLKAHYLRLASANDVAKALDKIADSLDNVATNIKDSLYDKYEEYSVARSLTQIHNVLREIQERQE